MAETSSSLLLNKNNKRTTRGKVTFDPANPDVPVTLTVDTTTVNNRGRKINSTSTYTQNASGQFVDTSGKAWIGESDKQAGLVRASMGKKINDTKQSNEIMDKWAKNNRVTGTNKKEEGNAGGGDGTDKGETKNETVKPFTVESTATRNFGDLKYPYERTDGQDYCKITQYKYRPNEFKLGPATRPNQRMTETKGTVILPIPPGLTDSNSSNWQGHTMNALQAQIGQGATNAMNSDKILDAVGEEAADMIEQAKNTPGLKAMAKAWALGGIPGLGANTAQALARGKGAIINPNEELLFQGPAMRSMDYGWRLTPRFQQEATMVQKIIRFFKQGSAAQVSSGGGLFLVTPNVFHVQFFDSNGREHPFIGKRKKAALASMSVNYVPDGTYMTLPNSSMTAYDIGLSFMELEPILEDDYHQETTSVGY